MLAAAGEGAILAGPEGTTPPLLGSVGLDTGRAELVSKETMFTDWGRAHSRPWWGERECLSGGPGGPRGHPIFAIE